VRNVKKGYRRLFGESTEAASGVAVGAAFAVALSCSPFLKSGDATFGPDKGSGTRQKSSGIGTDSGADTGVGDLGAPGVASASGPPTMPASIEPIYLKAPHPQPSAWFGYGVAADGDRLGVAVTAPLEDVNREDGRLTHAGVAYLFEPVNDDWRPTPLVAFNADPGDGVVPGAALPHDIPPQDPWGSMRVDMNDDVVVVGVAGEGSGKRDDPFDNSAPLSGAVYVYDRNALGSTPAYLKAPVPEVNALFGTGLGLSGSRLAVGAPQAEGAGIVYVFEQQPGVGTFGAPVAVRSPNPDPGDLFGESVALRGEMLVVGAPGEDSGTSDGGPNRNDNGTTNSGAAYVFKYTGGNWTLVSFLKAEPPLEKSFFGFSVAVTVEGHTVAVGAPTSSSCPHGGIPGTARGAVWLAHDLTGAGDWAPYACNSPLSGGQGVLFGWATRLFWNELLVSAPFDYSGTDRDPFDTSRAGSGAAYLYERDSNSVPIGAEVPWSTGIYVKAPNPGARDVFGNDVAVGNGIVVIGAPRESGGQSGPNANLNDDSTIEAGAVYVFAERRSYPIH
jgi:hypothetical protein